MTAIPLRQAARELGVSEPTVRRWVRQGAPASVLGGPGRGRGSKVCVDHLRRWRAKEAAGTPDASVSLDDLERFLVDFHRAGDHRKVGLRDDGAAVLYIAFYEYVIGRLTR